jgi:integrase
MKRGRIYNKFFNEDEWKLVNQENKDLIEDYTLELKQNQKKISTIKQYNADWKIIMLYIYKKLNNASILSLNKKHFRKFSLYLTEECEMSNARCNRMMSALRSLLTYCEDDDDIEYENNVAKKVRGLPKKEVREIVFLTDEQIIRLKDKLIEMEEYQKATLLMLAYDSAGRKGELAQVQKYCFSDSERSNTNKVVGTRGTDFFLAYYSGTKECAKLYLDQRGEDDVDCMWTLKSGDQVTSANEDNLYEWVVWMANLLGKMDGEECLANVHSLRHSCLENFNNGSHYALKEIGKENFSVQELALLANHSSSDTTETYLKDRKDEKFASAFGFTMKV